MKTKKVYKHPFNNVFIITKLDISIYAIAMMYETLKQVRLKILQNLRFKCHYLKTGGRKHPGCLKNGKSISTLYENKKVC